MGNSIRTYATALTSFYKLEGSSFALPLNDPRFKESLFNPNLRNFEKQKS